MRRVLLWDLMDTLARDPFFAHMPAFFGLSFEEMLAHKHPHTWKEFELGQCGEEQLYRAFFRDGRAIDGPAFKAFVAQSYSWIPGMEALCARLHAAGTEMHLLSNYPPWYALCVEALGIDRFVAPTFVSCKTGVRKPDAEAYLVVCRTLDVTPEQCVFVDDREVNCEAARKVGMASVRFEGDAGALATSLTELGLLAR
jgi:HAD superfamily hydrolase (TIGR01509 family)